MARFIIRRLLLSLITLAILLVIVRLIPNIAPGGSRPQDRRRHRLARSDWPR